MSFAVLTKITDSETNIIIRACTADFEEGSPASKRAEDALPESKPVSEERTTSSVRVLSEGSTSASAASGNGLMAASQHISKYMSNMGSKFMAHITGDNFTECNDYDPDLCWICALRSWRGSMFAVVTVASLI